MVVYRFGVFLYRLLCFAVNTLLAGLDLIWMICNFSSLLIPWLLLVFMLLCIGSRFVRLRSPPDSLVTKHLHRDENQCQKFPVANQGAGLDAPENSLSAIQMCLKLKCRLILLNLELLADELVILNRYTLEKMNMRAPVDTMSYKSLENVDVAEHHPLGKNFPPSKIITLASLISEVATQDVTIFLACPVPVNGPHRERLVHLIRKNEQVFKERICIVSSNPLFIYQLRKEFPDLVCGLWLDRGQDVQLKCLKSLTILNSIKGAFLRNVVAPVVGIKLVFIHKTEFNEQISDLWNGWRIRPVVYPVNSANEKRYFQRITKTQYLTDSLRTEPDLIRARS